MKRRAFSLETVLELRAAAKKKAEDALATGLKNLETAIARCKQADEQLAKEANQLAGERFTAVSRIQGWNSLELQQRFCKQLHLRRKEEENRVLHLRLHLINASRDHELVLRLKEKWKQSCLKEDNREQEMLIEEFVNARRNQLPPNTP